MFSTPKVELAISLAKRSHEGQLYNGAPYFDAHIQKVAEFVDKNYLHHFSDEDKEIAMCAAYLHDVVEDTETSLEEIEALFGLDVAKLVSVLTRDKNTRYFNYILNISSFKTAPFIKLADLNCNMANATEKDKFGSRYAKYEFAKLWLERSLYEN